MTTAEKYIYQVYAEQSFSKAAESLFISQPSLSTAVARKERELGFAIFDRTTKPITLTPQGQIYLDMLEEMLESEKNMQLRVQRLSSGAQNVIGIGSGLSTGYYLLPDICGAFHRQHPEVEMMVDLGNLGATTSLLERLSHFQRLDRGEIDTVLCYEYDADKYAGDILCKERLVVAMHRSLAPTPLLPLAVNRQELLQGTYPPEKEIRKRHLFREIPFFDFLPNSSTGRFIVLREASIKAQTVQSGSTQSCT
ncbi:MAG: LysR family transcriptional regulator [Ruminococcaceae bacterium]|nr:LysR family transcriptional regulator [Oscillospiraceae bacterium]